MLVPVSHLPAVSAASCPRVVHPFHGSTARSLSVSGSNPRPQQPRPTPPHPKPTPTRMDPDQAAAAGVQHTSTSADGRCGGGGGGDSWGRALLRRGWDLSRKAAIAGVAATAAPVVAPPLLVLSLAGVALSLPFAAYLASLVATDRLMAALLPPPRTQPCHTYDLEDDEFLDAPEAHGGEAPAFDYWSEREDDAIVEEDESYASLPLSRQCRLSEEPVPAWNDEEDPMLQGEFRFQESGHESFVLDNNRAQKEDDNEYITMEAMPPRGFDDSRSAAPELCEEDEEPVQELSVEAPVAADEPVQELSVSDNGDKTEDGKRAAMEEMESSNEMVSPAIDMDTSEVSGFPLSVSGEDDLVVQRAGESEVSVSDVGDKTEEMLSLVLEKTVEMTPQEVNVSESSAPDDNTLQSKIEEDVTVEMVLEEVTNDTIPVTEEVGGVQMDAIATELPECEPLHQSDLVAQEPQAMAEAAYADDVLESTLTDVVLGIGDQDTEGVEHNGEGDVPGVVSVVTVSDVADLTCSTSAPNVSAISDDMMNVESRAYVDHSNQITGVEHTLAKKGLGKKELVEDKSTKTEESKSMSDKVPTRSMAPQDIDVSKSPAPDDQSKREDEVTVETVLEEVTSATDLDTREVVGVQVDVIASGSESVPVSDLVPQELQPVTVAATVDSIQGSTVSGDIVTDIDDTNIEGVEHHSEGGASSFVSGASVVTMDDAEDVMSSRRKPHVSAISEDIKSVEGMPDVEHPHGTTGFEYKLSNEGLKRKALAEEKDNYTEEQLREQLDTLITITGYRPEASLTLEAGLAGLYIFVGVEPPVSSRDASYLTRINMKLQFLKSIIGVE
ncbi:hypothetical protein C2845_PM03G06020 [Panicum miliaceum]|uniref:Uncharacterized protein n=1 Tax=Panicum miliaceum TaxID=4540 RepID=A0A3L6TDS2_PANMI|nr:hypothetical protein C2845_PM03G06020 [Panicum miliaceum]